MSNISRDDVGDERRIPWSQIDWDNLSDEHCAHICRFLDLGPWDRQKHERMKGYVRWKIENKRAMNERDSKLSKGPRP
jgi:hypothetical protein